MHVQNECLLELLRVVFATIMFSVAVPKQITIITHKGCNQSVGPDTKAVACLAMWLPISWVFLTVRNAYRSLVCVYSWSFYWSLKQWKQVRVCWCWEAAPRCHLLLLLHCHSQSSCPSCFCLYHRHLQNIFVRHCSHPHIQQWHFHSWDNNTVSSARNVYQKGQIVARKSMLFQRSANNSPGETFSTRFGARTFGALPNYKMWGGFSDSVAGIQNLERRTSRRLAVEGRHNAFLLHREHQLHQNGHWICSTSIKSPALILHLSKASLPPWPVIQKRKCAWMLQSRMPNEPFCSILLTRAEMVRCHKFTKQPVARNCTTPPLFPARSSHNFRIV